MKISIKTLVIFVTLTASVFAQDIDLLKQNLLSLDRRITTLDNLSQRYQNIQAKNLVNSARLEYEQCLNFIREFRLAPAWISYKSSSAYADMAAKLLLVKPVLRLNSEVERLIQRAESLVATTNRSEARYMLTRARSFKREATRAFEAQRFMQGQEYQRIALYFAKRAIELSDTTQDSFGRYRDFNHVRDNIKKLYQDISAYHRQNPLVHQLLQKAETYMQAAEKAYGNGNYQNAILQLQIAERLLYRAADLSQQNEHNKKDKIAINLESLENYITGIESVLIENESRNGQRLLRKARQFLNSAKRDYEKGAYQSAESKISLAQKTATRALKFSIKTQDDDIRISQRITELNHLISLQEAKVTDDNREVVLFFHQQARELIKSAEKAVSDNRPGIALRKVQIALRVINRVESLLGNKQQVIQDEQDIMTRFRRVKDNIRNVESKQLDNPQIDALLPVMKRMMTRTGQAIEKHNYLLANELLDFIQRQLTDLYKNVTP